MGYEPNRAARSLVTGRSESIALVIPEPTTRLFGEPFWPRLVRGIADAVADNDFQLVLLLPQDAQDELRVTRYLAAGHVDGALLVSLHGDDPLPARLVERRVPVVVGGRPPGDQPSISSACTSTPGWRSRATSARRAVCSPRASCSSDGPSSTPSSPRPT